MEMKPHPGAGCGSEQVRPIAAPTPQRFPLRSWIVRRLSLVLLLLVVPGVALAATVTVKGKTVGTAKLLNPVWNEAKDSKSPRYTFREPSATVRADVRTLTAYLSKELCIAALADKGEAAKAPLRVVIAGGRTSPVTLVVAEGQLIQFENQDPFPHKLYDVDGKGGLQAAQIDASKTRQWTPAGPGKYEIRDQFAPSIRSWIVVEPGTVAVAYPDRRGEFAIDVPPGKYTLRAYFNGEKTGSDLDINVAPAPAEQLLREPLKAGDIVDAGEG